MQTMRAAMVAATVGGAAAGIVPPLGGTVGATTREEIEIPLPGFPGATPEASNSAWPSGKQPKRLQYWPQTSFGLLNRSLLDCWKVSVLHDTADGWPGLCVNLARHPTVSTEYDCMTFCEQEPRCPVWQFVNQTTPGECWVGFGTNCANRKGKGADISVQRSQRIMHGDVAVLKQLQGWKVENLYQIGKFESGDDAMGVTRCKAWCYSSLSCQYWQYSASAGGCFVDAPMFSSERNSKPDRVVQYPLTTAGGATPDASFQEGEYIVHYCPPLAQTTPPAPAPVFPGTGGTTSTAGDGGFINPWLIGPVAALALVMIACFFFQRGGAKSKSRVSRADSAYSQDDDEGDTSPLMQSRSPAPPPPPPQYSGRQPSSGMPSQRSGGQQLPPRPGAPGSGSYPPGAQRQGQMAPSPYGPGVPRAPTPLADMGQQPRPGSARPGGVPAGSGQLFNSQGRPMPAAAQPGRGY